MRVFASAVGQFDNVGDTVLRRGYLDALRGAGPMRIYIGHQTDDQLGALGIRSDDELVRSSAEWRRTLSRTVGREPVLYAFDTGETELARPFAARYARLAPLLAANRLRGGRSVHTGLGVRRSTAWRGPVAAALRVVDLVTWRDELSRRAVRVGGVAPDWAFAHRSSGRTDGARRLLAFAVRSSLPHAPRQEPDEAWADRAHGLAADLGLQPVFVAQIGRDGPLADRLARRARGDAVLWESDDHAAFEARLRDVYARSAAIVSDRLHGLVIGATEGALPIPLAAADADKSVRTLAAADIAGVAVRPDLREPVERFQALLDRSAEIRTSVLTARARLDTLREQIGSLAA